MANSNLRLRQKEKLISDCNSSWGLPFLLALTCSFKLIAIFKMSLARTHGKAKVSAEMFDGIFLPEPGEHLFN